MGAEAILAVITAILRYGPNAIIAIAAAMKSDGEVTAEDIQALFIDKEPEEYFPE